MLLFYLIPVIFFFFCLYKLVKDDYLLIRKNVSPEQIFDIAFMTFFISIICARLLYLVLHHASGSNLIILFFSPKVNGLSLVGSSIGGIFSLYVMSKSKRVPLGRLFDFFSLSFLVSLPPGYLISALFVRGFPLLLSMWNAAFYLIIMVIFLKLLYPKIMNRSLKDGIVSLLFLLLFSFVSLVDSLFPNRKLIASFDIEKLLLVLLFIMSIVILVFIEQNVIKGRRGR